MRAVLLATALAALAPVALAQTYPIWQPGQSRSDRRGGLLPEWPSRGSRDRRNRPYTGPAKPLGRILGLSVI